MIAVRSVESLVQAHHHFIDVRAPVEFAKGALPGAVNLPILNDDERHLVGTEYKQQGQESAITLGTKLVGGDEKAARVAAWCHYIQQHPDALLYCFRGGLRSRTAIRWIEEAGVSCQLIEGGYKHVRQLFIEQLQRSVATLPLIVVGGRTGTGKTSLLNRLPRRIDLEGLAHHRGSSFGALLEAQPSNIDFEHALTMAWLQLQKSGSGCIYLEDEARMVGRVCIPEVVRNKMQLSPLVLVEADNAERVSNVIQDYIVDLLALYQSRDGVELGFKAFSQHHTTSVLKVQKRLGGADTARVLSLLEVALGRYTRDEDPLIFGDYVETLLTRYYDPMYDYQLQKKKDRVVFTGGRSAVLEWCIAH